MLLFFSEQVSVNEAKKGQFSTRSLLIFEMQFSPRLLNLLTLCLLMKQLLYA